MRFWFDDDMFAETARLVLRYNAENTKHHDVASLIKFMKDMAQKNPNTIGGTLGFYVCSVPSKSDRYDYICRAFPAPWLIP